MNTPFAKHILANQVPSDREIPAVQSLIQEHQEIVDQLKTQIEDVESTLRALRDRMEAHTKLIQDHKALISPVRKLSVDLLCSIFLFCNNGRRMARNQPDISGLRRRPSSSNMTSAHPSVVVSHVCKHWRQVSLSSPLLWSEIELQPPRYPNIITHNGPHDPPILEQDSATVYRTQVAAWEKNILRLKDALRAWIGRSGECPLSVNFTAADDSQQCIKQFVDTLCEQSSRWKDVTLELRISGPTSPLNRFILLQPREAPLLEAFGITVVFPEIPVDYELDDHPAYPKTWTDDLVSKAGLLKADALRSLSLFKLQKPIDTLPVDWSKLTSLSFEGYGYGCSAHNLGYKGALTLLRACVGLTHCSLLIEPHYSEAGVEIPDPIPVTEPTTLPFLHTLLLAGSPSIPIGFASSLDLPSLRSLSILGYTYQQQSETDSGLVEFVECYGSALTRLSFNYSSLIPSALLYCLERVPNVVELGLTSQSTSSFHFASLNGVQLRMATMTSEVLHRLTPPLAGDSVPDNMELLCPRLERLYCQLSVQEFTEEDLFRFVAGRRRVSKWARIRWVSVIFATLPTGKMDINKELQESGVDLRDFFLTTTHPDHSHIYAGEYEYPTFPVPLEELYDWGL